MFSILICILAGLGAGITTGFAGLSAAVFITPMLTVFLDVSFYDAVGIALASDVLASAVSAITYFKNGNIDLKHGMPLMLSVWGFAILGSIAAYFLSAGTVGNSVLGYWSILASFLVGADLFLRAGKSARPLFQNYSGKRLPVILICGVDIGFICGFQGTGGGMMLLMALTLVMSYPYKTAVGTSVFIMAVTALLSAASHFSINGLPDFSLLAVTVLATTGFALLGSYIANKISAPKLKRATGMILVASSVFMLVFKFVQN